MDAKILYVEDNPMNVKLVHRMLKFSGYDVSDADNGADGLHLANHDSPDLILLDIDLPDMDGLDVARRIKATPHLRHTPIVALTAHSGPEDRKAALRAGCDGYLPKPVSRSDLLRTVQHYLAYVRI